MLRNRMNLCLIFAIFVLVVVGCDAWVTLNGKVVDEDGKPINVANILIKQGDSKVAEKLTSRDGSFHIFENIVPGPLGSRRITIIVEKEGYQIFQDEFDWTDVSPQKEWLIRLTRK